MLAWLVAEDDGARARVTALLAERDLGLRDVRATLEEQLREIDAADEPDAAARDMLSALVAFLQ